MAEQLMVADQKIPCGKEFNINENKYKVNFVERELANGKGFTNLSNCQHYNYIFIIYFTGHKFKNPENKK